MTPKEKAVELFTDYRYISSIPNAPLGELKDYMAKQCSLRAADEILEFMRMDDEHSDTASNANSVWVNYWLTVKQEIEKL
jgi:hypothetical protein